MEEFGTIIAFLIVVFAVLQIILFFKIWGMTNDIKDIKKKIPTNDRIRDAEIAYLTGNAEIAKRILDEYYIKAAKDLKQNPYSSDFRDLKWRIEDTYKYLGIEKPEDVE